MDPITSIRLLLPISMSPAHKGALLNIINNSLINMRGELAKDQEVLTIEHLDKSKFDDAEVKMIANLVTTVSNTPPIQDRN
jgi:uncharacterized protein YegL